MKQVILTISLSFAIFIGYAQVGINNASPDKSAALHIKGDGTKGLLLPEMNDSQRNEAKESAGNGLLVYDANKNIYFFFNKQTEEWIALNPIQASDGNTGSLKLADGGSTITFENDISITQNLTVSNEVDVTQNITGNKNIIAKDTVKASVVKASVIEGYGVTPIGGIIMWSGTIVPDGWALCDGRQANGYKTPDLRGRFVAGYGADDTGIQPNVWDIYYANPGNLSQKGTQIGTTGGEMKHVLSLAEMPKHNHSITDPGHTHTFNSNLRHLDYGNSHDITSVGQDNSFELPKAYTSITINDNGGGQSHENRPPYYVLAFIMRIK